MGVFLRRHWQGATRREDKHTVTTIRTVVPVRAALGAALLLAQLFPLTAAAQAPSAATPRAGPEAAQQAVRTCTACHNENWRTPVLEIFQTKHAVSADKRTPFADQACLTCHGPSAEHLKNPVASRPDMFFGHKSTIPVAERNAKCLTCHQGGKRMLWAGSTHDSRDVACASCHQIHAAQDKVREKLTQPQVCFTCHKEKRVEISRPYRHPILEGKVVCSDCHNTHGTAGPTLLVRDGVNATCYTCHMEKRGPFVRNHQPVTENCAICHNPHGTTNRAMLRQRLPFLCQQCHEASTHQGNIASRTATSTGANTLARGCENCHTNIHGTNNPANDAGQRTFRR
jgi:DmsE family decaheme c-type cytochrome